MENINTIEKLANKLNSLLKNDKNNKKIKKYENLLRNYKGDDWKKYKKFQFNSP